MPWRGCPFASQMTRRLNATARAPWAGG
jgi:hypothetical protein